MPHTWKKALDAYCYPVNLTEFADAAEYPDWFECNIETGDRRQTMDFEDRFRKHGRDSLEAWGQVAFWKNYNMPPARNKITRKVLAGGVSGAHAADLWWACDAYVKKFDLESFREFRKLLFPASNVATAATFPAFVRPDKFPMVDRQITRWAVEHGTEHSYPGGPAIECVPDLSSGEMLGESHWPFVESWIRWCRFTACKLEKLTGDTWRARDVEMAVFTAQKCAKLLTDTPGKEHR